MSSDLSLAHVSKPGPFAFRCHRCAPPTLLLEATSHASSAAQYISAVTLLLDRKSPVRAKWRAWSSGFQCALRRLYFSLHGEWASCIQMHMHVCTDEQYLTVSCVVGLVEFSYTDVFADAS